MSTKSNSEKELDQEEVQLFLKAAHDVLKLLEDSLPEGVLPTKCVTIKNIRGSEVIESDETLLNPLFYYQIDNWVEKYRNLTSVFNYLKYVFENKIVDIPVFRNNDGEEVNLELLEAVDAYVPLSDEDIIFPVVHILVGNLNFDITDNELVDSFQKYVNARRSATVQHITNTPLMCFDTTVTSFKFSEEFTLSKFSDHHKNAYLKYTYLDLTNGYTLRELCQSTYMLRSKVEFSRGDTTPKNHEIHLYLLIASIRLVCKTSLIAKYSFREPAHLITGGESIGKWHFATSKPMGPFTPYNYNKLELEKSKSVFIQLLKIENIAGYQNIFRVVIKRYLSSLSRVDREDSLIDFTICLESLLLAHERDELKYRLQLRGVYLLKTEDPEETKKTLASMYDDRSKIVHAGKTISDIRRSDGHIYMQSYRSVTEKIILAYIKKSADFDGIKQINDHLDLEIFTINKS